MGPYELVSHAAWTGTPAVFCCIVARIRLAGVGAAPVLVAGDFPASIVGTPPPLNVAGPVQVAAPAASRAVPPAVLSASTPTPPAAAAPPCAGTESAAPTGSEPDPPGDRRRSGRPGLAAKPVPGGPATRAEPPAPPQSSENVTGPAAAPRGAGRLLPKLAAAGSGAVAAIGDAGRSERPRPHRTCRSALAVGAEAGRGDPQIFGVIRVILSSAVCAAVLLLIIVSAGLCIVMDFARVLML